MHLGDELRKNYQHVDKRNNELDENASFPTTSTSGGVSNRPRNDENQRNNINDSGDGNVVTFFAKANTKNTGKRENNQSIHEIVSDNKHDNKGEEIVLSSKSLHFDDSEDASDCDKRNSSTVGIIDISVNPLNNGVQLIKDFDKNYRNQINNSSSTEKNNNSGKIKMESENNQQPLQQNLLKEEQLMSINRETPSPIISTRSDNISINSLGDSSILDSDSDTDFSVNFNDNEDGNFDKIKNKDVTVRKLGFHTKDGENVNRNYTGDNNNMSIIIDDSDSDTNSNKDKSSYNNSNNSNNNNNPSGMVIINHLRQQKKNDIKDIKNELVMNTVMTAATSCNASGAEAGKPQIGSIAVQNSADITFGSKTFYQGPITIKQFLVENKNSSKPSNNNSQNESGFVNSAFNPDDDSNDSQKHNKEYSDLNGITKIERKYTLRRKLMIIAGLSILLTLGIIAIVFTIMALAREKESINPGDGEDSRKNVPINSTIGNDHSAGGQVLNIITRSEWLAQPPVDELGVLTLPVNRVIIAHTATEDCVTRASCAFRVRVIQKFHIESRHWSDIGYNFLVGGDGCVYEGRGWDKEGAHTRGFNKGSIGIAFIGTFNKVLPPDQQIKAAQLMLNEGIKLGKLTPDYKLYGHRQLIASESPGEAFYKVLKTWPHWSEVETSDNNTSSSNNISSNGS